MSEKIFKNCQSCGMPIKKDSNKGSEKDGSKSTMFCVHCYADGKFTYPNMTVTEMQEFVIKQMNEVFKMPKFIAKSFAKKIPKLERWNKD